MDILERFKNCGIIPVVVLENVEDAVPLAKALLKGGINVAEITFRTNAAIDSIKEISTNVPKMLVGAGTILNSKQAIDAINAGAKFIVSPGFDKNVVEASKENNVTVIPGTVTPSEVMQAINSDLSVVKFFPAGNYGGLKTIKSLSAPFGNLLFMPTGSVNINNLREYLEFDKIISVGGSWICDKKLIEEKNWDEITQLCLEARKILKEVRK